jgi:hypothetical protein
LVEIEFHDTPNGYAWIMGNINAIASALCRAIVAQMGLSLKVVPVPVKVVTNGGKVTINAFALKYATGQFIPLWVKRTRLLKPIVYTVVQMLPLNKPTKVLLGEIKSWVCLKDVKPI